MGGGALTREKSFVRWAATIAHDLCPGWQISLHFGDPGEAADASEAAAKVSCVWGRRSAHITYSPEIFKLDAEEQRYIVVHEFVHIPFYGVTQLVEATIPPLVGKLAWEAFQPGLTKTEEDATDAFAHAIAGFFPLWEGR